MYPRSPLADDVALSRAEYLARAGRHAEAAAAVERLVDGGRHGGRRGELLRLLGDLRVKLDDCEGAKAAYARALASGPAPAARAAIERGLARCAGR